VSEHDINQREYIGTVLFRLYDEVVPMTADNFRMLATGQQGYGYHGMVLSCVILGFLIQGGDCDNGSVFDGVSLFIPWGRVWVFPFIYLFGTNE
jgi:cyclophilin family peptidyl-prolyl cis-trans isomerase